MKIVIAGGTGFLGRPLARALAADGREVVILTRRPSGIEYSATNPSFRYAGSCIRSASV